MFRRLLSFMPLSLLASCTTGHADHQAQPPNWDALRARMVATQIERRGVSDPRVLAAMRTVPRHEFVPTSLRDEAYEDYPLPIGFGQTISQPYIVAAMTEALQLRPSDKVLEIGTGSGYQAAVLALLVSNVYSIEIIPELAQRAATDLARLGYTNVHVRAGDGYAGWPEFAPFDAIIVTCAPEQVPQPLVAQLSEGGRIVIPVGGRWGQTLVRLTKRGKKLEREDLMSVIFVPMTGAAQDRAD
ncbi:MAG: protein-L-isoaspartate(D-aspartate) O-methyltransferase [bacterium]|nr:protein-L-isoaspartate(D-aspartate) O-methyltransferase [bacterium]